MTINHHDLSGLNFPVIILPVKSRQFFCLKVLCQSLCPGTGAGQKCDPISLFLILL